MDTDDLSKETYKAILIESEKFNHDLTLQFGLLAEECKDEKDYIQNSLELINELKEMDEDEFPDIFFDEIPDKKVLIRTLEKIKKNILKVQGIPFEKRHFDF
jgi:hypothetical protein